MNIITGDVFISTDGDTQLEKDFVKYVEEDFENNPDIYLPSEKLSAPQPQRNSLHRHTTPWHFYLKTWKRKRRHCTRKLNTQIKHRIFLLIDTNRCAREDVI